MSASLVGDQLCLFEGGLAVLRLPWNGRSPRALTRGHRRFILKAQADKSMGDFVDPAQGDLWPEWTEGPFYEGAPLLLVPKMRRQRYG